LVVSTQVDDSTGGRGSIPGEIGFPDSAVADLIADTTGMAERNSGSIRDRMSRSCDPGAPLSVPLWESNSIP
jgi:hypothetical protein